MTITKQRRLLEKYLTSESFIAFFISLTIWGIFFIASGVLFSGFHFIDDHEIVLMNHDLQTMHLHEVIHKWLIVDYNIPRFRPAYYIHRVLQTQIFGLNWTLWYAYAWLQISITTACLFIFARSIQFSTLESALLTGLAVWGQQSITWFRLGPAETTAMPFLAFALVCAAIDAKKYNLVRDFFFVFSTLLASLCKESFVLFIPVICLVRVWRVRKSNPTLSFKHLFYYRDTFPCYFLLLILGLELLYIKFVIGTRGTGYAGVDSNTFNLTKIISIFSSLAQQSFLLFALIFLVSFCLLLLFKAAFNRSMRSNLDRSLLIGLAFVLIVFPQVLLYTKSGFAPHYLFPAIIGCSLLNIQTLALYRQNELKGLKWLLVIILIVILFQNIQIAWISFNLFSLEGKETKTLFSNIESCTQENSPILVITHPRIHYEFSYSLKQYLDQALNRKNLFVSTYGLEGTDFQSDTFPQETALSFLDPKSVNRMYDDRSLDAIQTKSDIEAIIVFPRLKEDFLATSESWFQPEQYRQSNHRLHYYGGSILLYCKK